MTMDISIFCLMTPLAQPEYIRVKLSDIPDEIIKEYDLQVKATKDRSVYIVANPGMYSLPQFGLLANQLFEKSLNKHSYHQSKLVLGLWNHKWKTVQFTLLVDDVGVNYASKEHMMHLKKMLEEPYTITTK